MWICTCVEENDSTSDWGTHVLYLSQTQIEWLADAIIDGFIASAAILDDSELCIIFSSAVFAGQIE